MPYICTYKSTCIITTTMKKALLPAVLAAFACAGAWAQIITTDPPILTQSSKNITITYHADDEASNKALANLPSSTPVYAHVGLITDKSAGTSDWKYAQTGATMPTNTSSHTRVPVHILLP